MFEELADTSSPYFSRRVKLLETVAKLEFCVLMIDTGSEDLILKMFTVFYDVVRLVFFFVPSILYLYLLDVTVLHYFF